MWELVFATLEQGDTATFHPHLAPSSFSGRGCVAALHQGLGHSNHISCRPRHAVAHGRAQVNKLDWLVFNVALFCTMFAGVDVGLGISIGVSIFLALYKTAFPKTAVLGRLPETTVFRRVPCRASWHHTSRSARRAAPGVIQGRLEPHTSACWRPRWQVCCVTPLLWSLSVCASNFTVDLQ